MNRSYRWALALLVAWPMLSFADEPAKKGPLPVPFRRTVTQHIMVRAKINGKGPFNFIVDTGAPIMFVSLPVGKQLGLETDNGWATLDRLDLEGGISLTKVKTRVDTPFQLEGMNGMGLAGAELHGILGYTILAKYRMEIDFSRDRMMWTPLDFDPPPPFGIGGKGGQGGLEVIGTFMKFLGYFAGIKQPPDPAPRAFIGVELKQGKDTLTVAAVLDKGPAHAAGLKEGDVIIEVNGQPIQSMEDFRSRTASVIAGSVLPIVVRRDKEQLTLKITTGEGL